ncbi:autotransporter outer membrane beta-barrel domain-containing protein [Bradyrhizobium sp. ORS 86]|uniref:autotransporter family protein n=1 Tax=Bradyrhizobium sp. ORS 86 TaxID=1685970 RepID=UPI003890607C
MIKVAKAEKLARDAQLGQPVVQRWCGKLRAVGRLRTLLSDAFSRIGARSAIALAALLTTVTLGTNYAEAGCNPGVSCTAGPGEVLALPSAANPSLSYTAGTQALVARGAGASVTATGITFTATTNTVIAGAATLPGTIVVNGGTVVATSGSGGTAALQQQGLGLLTATDTVVRAAGVSGDAAIRLTASAVNPMTLKRVQVFAAGTTGLDADSPTAPLVASDVRITTTGSNADGVHGDGLLTMTGGSITTSGNSSRGLFASGAATNFAATDVFITTAGIGAHGVDVENGGTVMATSVSVTATGAGASALFMAGAAGTLQTANVSGSTLTSTAAPAISVLSGTADVMLRQNTAVSSESGVWLDVRGPAPTNSGLLNLTADFSKLTGAAITEAGATSSVTLQNGTIWRMTGNSNLTTLVNDASQITFTSPSGDPTLLSSYKTLTVANYTGLGGGITLNTFLGGDNSPSDRLIINGSAIGSTTLTIHNTTGPGDYTTIGIPVVVTTPGGTTDLGAFTLAGEVRAGFFDYRLFRGAPDGSSPDNWFLRSDFLGNGGNGGNGPVTPPGELPDVPAPDNGQPPPPGIWPIIGPEIATYGVVQPIARQMGLTTLGTLHERVGDAAADAACLNATYDSVAITKTPAAPETNCRPAVWGRLFGQQINNHYQAFADPRATGQVAGIQTGIDVWRGSLIPGHRDTVGVYFAYGNGNVSVDGLVTNAAATAYILQHTGSLNLNAYSFGGYWTHYGPAGWYIDAVLQGSFYNGNAATQFANLPTNGTGFTSSLEAGYPIPLPWFGPGFVLEPEGQIIWQRVSFGDADDGLGPVALGTTSGASGRLGLRGKWTIDDPAGRVWQPYVLANVWHDWGTDVHTMFGPESVLLAEQATRLEFAGGLSAKLLPGLTLYAQAGYQFAVSGTDGSRRDGVRGDFGARYSW